MWSREYVTRTLLSRWSKELTERVDVGRNNHHGWIFKPARKTRGSVNQPLSGVVLLGGDSSEDAVEFSKKMGALASTITDRGFMTLLLEPKDPCDSDIVGHLRASVALLVDRTVRRVAAVGFCVAACAVLDLAAQDGVLAAVVGAFPRTIPNCLGQGRNIRVPILSIFDAIEGWTLSEVCSLLLGGPEYYYPTSLNDY